MRNHKVIVSLIWSGFLVACSTLSPTATQTPTPSAIPTATLTATPTDIPLANLNGILFFDYNANGLREQPEPPIVGFEVCAKVTGKDKICVETDSDGRFAFSNFAPIGKYAELSFVDPNSDKPDLTFRYINFWKSSVTIPAHEINGIQVPEQNLNDTDIIPIEKGLRVKIGDTPEISLTQGFLTLPFVQSQVPDLYIFNYFDDLNESTSCGSPVSADGIAINYDGKYSAFGGGDPIKPRIGVQDSHEGLDYSIPLGSYIISASPKSKVWYLPHESNGELRVHTLFQLDNDVFQNAYGHLQVQLVKMDEVVYRGQIIGISGKTGASPYHQLHFDLSKSVPKQCNQYLDPFRAIFEGTYANNFSGSYESFWTVDNNPQFLK